MLAGIKTSIKKVAIGQLKLEIICIDDMESALSKILAREAAPKHRQESREACPHFGVIWPSAIMLSEFVVAQIAEYSKMATKTIYGLELGCGLGIPSLCLAKSFPIDIVATDRHQLVPQLFYHNAARNHITSPCCRLLDWRASAIFLTRYPWINRQKYDVIMGSDLLYEAWQPAALAATLSTLLATKGKAFVADPGRKYLDNFYHFVEAFGLSITDRLCQSMTIGKSTVRITLIQIEKFI